MRVPSAPSPDINNDRAVTDEAEDTNKNQSGDGQRAAGTAIALLTLIATVISVVAAVQGS
jgi:hypothetical protein